MLSRLCGVIALTFFIVANAVADEIRPAYLHLKEIRENTFDVFWKMPSKGVGVKLALTPVFDEKTQALTSPISGYTEDAFIERWQITREAGLDGAVIEISGLQKTVTEVLVHIDMQDGRSFLID